MKKLAAKLTAKQQRFVEEYLIDGNATQAAKRAGYSEKTAAFIGHENLRKPKIAELVQAAMDERSERTEITADRVLQEIAKLAFSDMSEYAEWGPDGVTLIESDTLTDDQAACVAEVSESVTTKSRNLRFKLHDKTRALEMLARHLVLFTERHEHEGVIGIHVTDEASELVRDLDRVRDRLRGRVAGHVSGSAAGNGAG